MRKAYTSLSYILFLFLSWPCAAQTLLPVIQLSAEESATAKQLAQALKDANERSATAKVAWQQFHQLYQTAHTNLPNLRFTEDFRLAVATMDSSTPGVYQLATVELTVEERQKLQALHREMTQSEESQKHAENNWKDFKIQLVLKHIGTSTTGSSGGFVRLSTGVGGDILVPNPWAGELAFTPDFKLATPLH
jgi:hypothetical protein